jgi:hypothetical protein
MALDISRDAEAPSLAKQMIQIREASGLSHTAIASTFARLARGPGKLSFQDFIRLRLFDRALSAATPASEFVGQRRSLEICITVNYKHIWFGLLSDKVAASAYLASYGLPTIPLAAIYAPELGTGTPPVLANREALISFLTTPANFPLFGKPIEGFQSLGSVALRRWQMTDGELERLDGRRIPLEQIVSEIESHYRSGYIFQPVISPHHRVGELCGERLASVRVVTALTESGPKVIRACWKIPAGGNMADNYWRAGNLLAQIDLHSGRVLRTTSGAGLDMLLHDSHPDTGTPLNGFEIPHWDEILQLALRGARLMRHVPLIGWDIAPAQPGPVIVEMNETPDFFLVQFADRRGILDGEFRAFMDFQAKNAAANAKEAKAANAKL